MKYSNVQNQTKNQAFKEAVAKAALEYLFTHLDLTTSAPYLGIGTGSTTNCFIEALSKSKLKSQIEGTVASSKATEALLKERGIPVYDLNTVPNVAYYIDGADVFNSLGQVVKGGGGALTREKILARASQFFICMVDETKSVGQLGAFPIPIEVIPMARSFVAREIVKLDGHPEYRQGFVTDNGNIILDVHNWVINKPIELEHQLNNIPGVVSSGLFAEYPPNVLLIAGKDGVYLHQQKTSI